MLIENYEFADMIVEEGSIDVVKYANGVLGLNITDYLEGPFDIPTVNLEEYGLVPAPGHVFVKNYGIHTDATRALRSVGAIGEPVRNVSFGPHDANANECKVLID